MDFKVSYERFIQNVKYQLIRIEKNIEKDVSEWEIKLAPSDRISVKANVLDSKGTTFKDHECKLESKIVEFEQRVVKLEKEKDRMKLDILNLKQEKSVLSNKLNHFQELKLFEYRLNKTLERKIRNKTDLKAQVSNNLQEIGRLEKQLKNEKNFHSAIEKEKKSLERKIEELQRQTTESNKANPQNLKPLKAKKMMKKKKANHENIYKCKSRLKESKTKLKYADRENSQLAEKNFFLVVEDALKQEKKKTQEINTLLEKWKKKFHELEEKIQTTVQNQAAYEFPMKEIDEEEELRKIHNRLQSTRMRTSQQQQNNYNRSTQANNYNYNRNNKNNR
ncbi:myosin heavy chain, clone 203-like [Toxorhynchites rutilus septentrionalis]|uniref:myosin heavy chain, clone 203-like n=1 Tax=Toxorhynchites rutilus septentrionalis TaxID=329112 RepID=UPI0024799048|nr:myosin heavy chain, clone 203-like [Toxorhynchites rutilus septentrionalis]